MKRKAVRPVPKGAEPRRVRTLDKALRPPRFLVVGIGASAGGLEAFTRILSPIPAGAELAIVLVQHLSRSHPSLLKELLSAKTSLTVVDGEDGLEIQRGFVYVIRPDTQLTVVDGHLRVRQRPTDRLADAPVDRLFESLAEQYGERAIGVVLSGSGHDGATGVRQIKAAGGIVLVQDPEEAESNGMPRAAVGVGDVADLVLPVKQLSEELLRLSEHPFFRSGPAEVIGPAVDHTASELVPLFQLVRRSTGVDFTHYKAPTVQRRIRRRMALHRIQDLSAYVTLLQADPAEVGLLHDDILIHVTGFFREPEAFAALGQSIIPELVGKHADGTPIRVWVPACSSGEEAYSVAIALLEALRDHPHVPLQIFGTDVSNKMVARARSGIYTASAVSMLDPERQRQFFVSSDGGVRVNPSVREHCVFARQDVTRDPPFSRLDLVLCRNLLIYLGQPLQKRAIEIFHYALNPGAYLVLGRSETVGSRAELFEPLDGRWKIYRRKPAGGPSAGLGFDLRSQTQAPALTGVTGRKPRAESDIQGEASRLLIERYAPPAIVVDSASRIVRSTGHTARYLELPSGDASLDVLRMVRRGLLSPLRSVLQEAARRGGTARRDGLLVAPDEERRVSLEVTPLGHAENRHFLIQFEEADPKAVVPARKALGKPRPHERTTAIVARLEDELNSTRQD
ncbi:MAG TPA: chemotaxis protein CheB, partial [Polyangiaceae bacterium]|nr:chemotaxis protein CheB [Polyangiaceae bacterium]